MLFSHALFDPSVAFQFSMWSHDVVSTSILLASDLKLGQYLKVWAVFLEMLAREFAMLMVSRKDSSPRHVFKSVLWNNYW
jgi:hypothetical protein